MSGPPPAWSRRGPALARARAAVVAACVVGLVVGVVPAARGELAPHLRATFAPGLFGRVARLDLFGRIGQALAGAASLAPQDRSTAVAMVLGDVLCPTDVDLVAASPERRGETLLRECGPFVPAGADPGRVIAEAGCGAVLRPLSGVHRELAEGPGVFLLLAWTAGVGVDGVDRALTGCRALLVPALLAPQRAEVGDLRAPRLAARLDVRLDGGRVSVGLSGGAGVALERVDGILRAVGAPSGRRIELAATKDGAVDGVALRDAAVALRAYLGEGGAAQVGASAATPYSEVVAVIDALRQAPGPPGGAPVELFPDVLFTMTPGPGGPGGGGSR